MRELLEPGKAPNCGYTHEQALVMNVAFDQISDISQSQQHGRLRAEVFEQYQTALSHRMSEQMLEREFLRNGEARPEEDLETAIMSTTWSINATILGFTQRTNVILDDMKKPFQRMHDTSLDNIDSHTAKHHQFHNMTCAYDKGFMTPLEAARTYVQSLGSLLLHKIAAKPPQAKE
jgi:hypothetical protein